MKKKKLIFYKIACFFMIFCMSFLMVGCFGSNPKAFEKEFSQEFGEDLNLDEDDEDSGYNSVLGMLGTKVLYRPNHYDYNTGSGGSEDKENNYYAQYAWQILNALYGIYGIIDKTEFTNMGINPIKYLVDYDESTDRTKTSKAYFLEHTEYDDLITFLHDSIRYKVNTFGTVTKDLDGNNLDDASYVIIGADYNTKWKWSFTADLGKGNLESAYLYSDAFSFKDIPLNNHVFTVPDSTADLLGFYSATSVKNSYQTTYLGTGSADDYDNYSEFVKALEYVIYCYALDLEPAQLTITPSNNSTDYAITLPGYNDPTDADPRSPIQQALDDKIALFNKIGSFVGLVNRQITKITNWILDNVIGENVYENDTFTWYEDLQEVDDGHGGITYTLDATHVDETKNLERDYENTVTKLVKGVCSQVTIGKEGEEGSGESIHVDERFLASEIKEYAGDTFLIQDDENFALTPENANLPYIQPLEYQSVTLMFSEDMYVVDLYIALKYDAGLDGTEDNVFNPENYIELIVDLNYYNHETNTLQTIRSAVTRVYDGPYYIDFLGEYDAADYDIAIPNGHQSGVAFEEIGQRFSGSNSPHPDAIRVNAFNPDVGSGILKTDTSVNNYDGSVLVSQSPLVITGLTNLRKYYSLIESQINEEGVAADHSYISGRLNSDMFAGSDGCDYLEITYKVIKKNGDGNTNYKFYTGLAFVNAASVASVDA